MKANEYLKELLKQKKLMLDHLHLENQKHIVAFETKRNLLVDDIDSLERQINVNKENK